MSGSESMEPQGRRRAVSRPGQGSGLTFRKPWKCVEPRNAGKGWKGCQDSEPDEGAT